MIQGIAVENGAFAGGAFDWATPFALLCGLGVVAGYALLGATWLVMKTEGPVAERARGQAKTLLLAVLGFMARGQPVDAAMCSPRSPRAGSRCRTFSISGRCRWSPR